MMDTKSKIFAIGLLSLGVNSFAPPSTFSIGTTTGVPDATATMTLTSTGTGTTGTATYTGTAKKSGVYYLANTGSSGVYSGGAASLMMMNFSGLVIMNNPASEASILAMSAGTVCANYVAYAVPLAVRDVGLAPGLFGEDYRNNPNKGIIQKLTVTHNDTNNIIAGTALDASLNPLSGSWSMKATTNGAVCSNGYLTIKKNTSTTTEDQQQTGRLYWSSIQSNQDGVAGQQMGLFIDAKPRSHVDVLVTVETGVDASARTAFWTNQLTGIMAEPASHGSIPRSAILVKLSNGKIQVRKFTDLNVPTTNTLSFEFTPTYNSDGAFYGTDGDGNPVTGAMNTKAGVIAFVVGLADGRTKTGVASIAQGNVTQVKSTSSVISVAANTAATGTITYSNTSGRSMPMAFSVGAGCTLSAASKTLAPYESDYVLTVTRTAATGLGFCSVSTAMFYGVLAGSASPVNTFYFAQGLSSLAVTPATPSINRLATQQFSLTANLSTGATQDVTSYASFSSNNTSNISITSGGLATGLTGSIGTTISATSLWGNASTTASVVEVATPVGDDGPPVDVTPVGDGEGDVGFGAIRRMPASK